MRKFYSPVPPFYRVAYAVKADLVFISEVH